MVGGERFATRQQFRINDLSARKAACYMGTPDVVHAWSGSAEPTLRRARALGISTVLERSSAQMLEQCRLLSQEYASLGLAGDSERGGRARVARIRNRRWRVCAQPVRVPEFSCARVSRS